MEFLPESEAIIFTMFDSSKNGQMFITDWTQYIRSSFMYMEYCQFGIQRYDWNTAANSDIKYITGQYNVFPYSVKENELQQQLDDFLTQHQDLIINYKEYMGWFRQITGFQYLKQPGLPARTTVARTAQAFKDLGFRFSKYNRKVSLKGINNVLNSRNYQYMDALKICIQEDSIAYTQKLNKGTNYVHRDFKQGDPDPA